MLQKIRDNAHGWWAYVMVPVLVILFALFALFAVLGGCLLFVFLRRAAPRCAALRLALWANRAFSK